MVISNSSSKLHDELDDVERIRSHIFGERCGTGDLFLVDTQVLADDFDDTFFNGRHVFIPPKRMQRPRAVLSRRKGPPAMVAKAAGPRKRATRQVSSFQKPGPKLFTTAALR